ncbi:uncharacterized protein LOC111135062 [Crassostrea virginica]|uniref:Uncharacterized protein LOC111135062 n=1 Tax=Crassostrea virginica TaxID=6565 RepID=A0A8B8EKZ4_CRAVI|nr:uncharacterized protein LOC111135062 [Crassostrea virginica]
MLSVVVIAVLLSGTTCAFRLGGDLPCSTVFWDSSLEDSPIQNASCSSGSIVWHYPEGTIRVHFPHVPDQVCITRGIAAYDDVISRVYLENGDIEQELQFSADGSVCVDPSGEEATVVFVGPQSMRTYMASFSYEVSSPELSVMERLSSAINRFVHTASRPLGALFRKWNLHLSINPM